MVTPATETESRRWTHFSSAVQLAIQRASHKWTYEDFCECFSVWCEEHPDAGMGMYKLVSEHMETAIQKNSQELFTRLQVKPAIDTLHTIVTDARTRMDSGQKLGNDVWMEQLEPWGAIRARTMPVLRSERDRLKAQLEEMERENYKLQETLQENVGTKEEADAQIQELLDLLTEVYEKWKQLPWDDVEIWGVQTRDGIQQVQPA